MRKFAIILFVTVIAFSVSAQIQDSSYISETVNPLKKRSYFGVALGASASTNGFGGNVTAALSKRFALRLGYEAVNMTFKDAFSVTQDNYTFNVSPTWKAGGLSAILDFYVFKGLYLSGGVVFSDMNLSAKMLSEKPVTIGSIEFTPDDLGELRVAVKPENKVAPYAALGFGRNISRDHRLTMSFELGAYYTGSYVVDLSGTQLFEANGQPANQGSIDNLNKTLKEISWSGLYPIVKLGISYKFYGKNK
ncbi:MAG: hypothetical protein PHV20_03280 [Bacteroidales bacterium]|nr:hypothetical protein [Bacteroidales bacterium]